MSRTHRQSYWAKQGVASTPSGEGPRCLECGIPATLISTAGESRWEYKHLESCPIEIYKRTRAARGRE